MTNLPILKAYRQEPDDEGTRRSSPQDSICDESVVAYQFESAWIYRG